MNASYDAAVVGAGVLGLAHAYHLALRGLRVIVFERHPRASGASVRNFGMIWPIGLPTGPAYDLAKRSRDLWLEVLRGSGLWYAQSGSLHLAYHEDEEQVLAEFAAEASDADRPAALLPSAVVTQRWPAVVPEGLRVGLWSTGEVGVDPRQAIAELPAWLNRTHSVDFAFDTQVLRYDLPRIVTTRGEWSANRLVICAGADFRELAPEAFADCGLVPCKLQMMRSQPYTDFRVGVMLAAGLTLRHYRSFATCPTLPALARRLDAEFPEYARYGIHVLLAQNGRGELVLGDSHEYGDAIEPFDKLRIDELILAYSRMFVSIPDLTIAARWHGIYAKHPTELYLVRRLGEGAVAVTGIGGMGMTLSFGVAEKEVGAFLGEAT